MGGDVFLPEFVQELERRGESHGAGIVGGAAVFVASGGSHELVVADRTNRRRLEIFTPPVRRILDGEITRQRQIQAGQRLAVYIKKAAAEWRVKPLVAAAGENVNRSLADIERDSADLLDGVDHQPEVALAAQFAECRQATAIAVGPLNGTEGDYAGTRRDATGKVFGPNFALVIGDDVDFDAVSLPLRPGNGDFEEFQIGEKNTVPAWQRDGVCRQRKAVTGALDQGDFVFLCVDQAGDGGTGSGAHLVHEDVVVGGRVERADHGPVKKFGDGFASGAGRERHASRIQENFIEKTGKVLAGGEHAVKI